MKNAACFTWARVKRPPRQLTKTTDAILAIGLKDGKIRWQFQATENDIFLTGCMNRRDGLNCPKEGQFRDVDFGASTLLAKRSDGKDILLAGQKSGTLWALDPDNRRQAAVEA